MKLFATLLATVSAFASLASATPILNGLGTQLSAKFPGESGSAINGLLADALALAASNEGLPMSDVSCVRDYASCPQGWAENGSGVCSPPLAYAGSCGAMDFSNLTPSEKMALAQGCDAEFSCMDACRKNYSSACPAGWSNRGGQCVAPNSYNGACVPVTKFFGDKTHWESMCQVSWPCA